MDENLEWLTQNTEDLKSNKGNLTFSTHSTLFRFFPLSSKTFCTPSWLNFWKVLPPPFNKGGGGGVPTMMIASSWSLPIYFPLTQVRRKKLIAALLCFVVNFLFPRIWFWWFHSSQKKKKKKKKKVNKC